MVRQHRGQEGGLDLRHLRGRLAHDGAGSDAWRARAEGRARTADPGHRPRHADRLHRPGIGVRGLRGHGVFTFAILDALARADTNSNGLIELAELIQHIDG